MRNPYLIFLILLSCALPLSSEGKVDAPKIKRVQKKIDNTPKVNVKGKVFSIKSLSPVAIPTVESVSKPENITPVERLRLKLPELVAGPSPLSPQIPASDLAVKLSPLVRHTLRIQWIGVTDPRLSPQWSAPSFLEIDLKPRSMDSFTDGEFRILESLVLLKSTETTPIAAGLANLLLNSKETRSAAHEILGTGFAQLNIRTASQEHYKKVLTLEKESPRAQRSLINALKSLKPNDYADAQILSNHTKKIKLEDKDLKALPLSLAREFIQKKDLDSAWNTLARVPNNSEQANEASFLKAMIMYRSNNVNEARTELESLLQKFQQIQGSKTDNKELKSLTASTLGQIYFQQGEYKKAFETYRQIDQEHPLWLESLVESAWSQILMKDFEGAAGNMFSLHTTYFKGAYKPESYIVRTVSYLQLCQYGDALSVLKDFLRKYKYAQNQIQSYKKANASHLDVVRDFLKAGSPKSFMGLPRSLLVEIARDPKFIELQRQLNEIEDDALKMNQLMAKVEVVDQKFLQSQKKYSQLLKDLETHIAQSNNLNKKESLIAEKNGFERHLKRLSLLRQILQESKKGLSAEVASFAPIWNQSKNNLKSGQNKALQTSFQNLETDLAHWLDQSELLYYEIHNGAGEHLRYQMATASPKKDSRSPASAFKKDDKSLQWAFDGEIWEDEVGHYRSSLKNVCPEDNAAQVNAGQKSGKTSSDVAQSGESL